MALQPGTQLGPYEIVAPIGAGGMGEVYRARDTRLGREVAVKVLPASFVGDPERLRRFEQEARAASALNHPNILTVHDFGTSEGAPYLVSELLVGESLRERLDLGALAPRKAIEIALQVARGLSAAHDRGIIHRDLKPENLFICRDGRVKILDFGLARLQPTAQSASAMANEQTLTRRHTEPGVVLGTAGYMSPEQVRGHPADARSDLFALGAILYEMLSGRRAFPGATAADVMTAVLTHEPPELSTVLPQLSPALERLLRHCLEKQPEERARSAHDLAFELESLGGASTPSGTAAARTGQRRLARWLWVAPVLAAVLALGWALGHGAGRKPTTSFHLAIALPPEAPLTVLSNEVRIAISPDGARLVYQTESSGLFVRPLDGFEAKPLAGAEHGADPFFSPDGAWVGFFADGKLKKAPLAGGPSIDLCDAPNGRGGSWGSHGTIVFAPGIRSGLARVDAGGGVPRPVTTLDQKKGENSHRWPQLLPGDDAVLFEVGFAGGLPDHAQIAVQSLRSGTRRVLVEGSSYARYLPSGHLVFSRGNSLAAAPMDLVRLELTGSPVSVLDDLEVLPLTGAAELAASATGTLVYQPMPALSRSVVSTNRAGALQTLPLPPRGYLPGTLSPNGDRLALAIMEGSKIDLWVYDLGRGSLQRLTSDGELLTSPLSSCLAWTPNGDRIAFSAFEKGKPEAIFWQLADGSAPAEQLTTGTAVPLSFSPDGTSLLFLVFNGTTDFEELWLLPLAGDRKPRRLLQARLLTGAVFSPDGRWIAYDSIDSSGREVYVQPYPGLAEKWQVSTEGGGVDPSWTQNGRELVYSRPDGKMMAVEITTQPTFRAGKPRVLFETMKESAGLVDVTPDGQRFFFVKKGDAESVPAHLNVVLGWFDELARRVPHGVH
jgi:eukaryotic-like serine/threonine-protein kinase